MKSEECGAITLGAIPICSMKKLPKKNWNHGLLCFFFLIFIFTLFYFIILYWFCHTLTWIHHGCTCVPKHEPPSHLPTHNISLGHQCAPAPSMLYPASDIDWRFNSYMIVYMLQCHSPKSSQPLPLPLSPAMFVWCNSPSSGVLRMWGRLSEGYSGHTTASQAE